MFSSADRVRSALSTLAASLEADGYLLEVDGGADGAFDIRIVATPSACEECLVPPQVFEPIIRKALDSNSVEFTEVVLHYPRTSS